MHCNIAYHRACLSGTVCPECSQDMDEMDKNKAAREKRASEAQLHSGRRQMQICLGILWLLVAFNLIFPLLLRLPSGFAFGRWIGAIWLLGLSYWTYTGKVWARILLVISVALTIIASATALYRMIGHSTAPALIYTGVVLFSAIAVFGFLVCSPDVYYFLAAQKHRSK